TLYIHAVNDAPVIADLGATPIYREGDEPVLIAGTATVSDIDTARFNGGTLTLSITSGGTPVEDVLSVRRHGSEPGQIGFDGTTLTYGGAMIGTVSGGRDGADLSVSLNGNATAEAVQALVRNLTYANNNGDDPTTDFLIVEMTLTDGQGGTSDPAI